MTALAVALALCAAITFGIAAVKQHRGVRRTVTPDRRQLSVRQAAALITDSGWRWGLVVMALGTAFHVAALALAPISLTQPINVLAVPTTILVTAVITRRRPAASVIIAAGAVVAGVACFVSALSDTSAGELPTPGHLALTGVAVIIVTVVLHLSAQRLLCTTRRGPGWLAPVLLAVVGAMNLGTASSTFRLLAQDLTHTRALPLGVAIALVCYLPVGLTAGSWSIQQAYAAGAASAVTATSTLVDPIVALTIGMAVLGETPHIAGLRAAGLIAPTVIAIAGVIHLTRHDDVTADATDSAPPVSTSPPPAFATDKDDPCASCSPRTSIRSSTTAPEPLPNASPSP